MALADVNSEPSRPMTIATELLPRARMPSLMSTGILMRMYSLSNERVFMNRSLIRKRMRLSTMKRYPRIITASKIRAIRVPRAAPFTSIRGAPKWPKIKV